MSNEVKPNGPTDASTPYLMHACATMLRDVLAPQAFGDASLVVLDMARELDARAVLLEQASKEEP